MKRFTQLYGELDRTTRTNDKVAAMVRYFREVPPADAAWGLFFLSGQKIKRTVSSTQLRLALATVTGLPDWLLDESYAHVGDLAETLALLLPENDASTSLPLAEFVESRVLRLRELDDRSRRELLHATWPELSSAERLVWHKLITGAFRVGVSATLVTRAVAEAAKVSPAIMAHRLTGHWQPTTEYYTQLISGMYEQHYTQPYPFFLAHPLESEPSELGAITKWQLEWKWDGIRAQVMRRRGELLVWSRGEELITERFPELNSLGTALPEGTVLDGEILAWTGEAPLPFGVLQRRIGRLRPGRKVLAEVPIEFLAFDLLEGEGLDLREQPLENRRKRLESLVGPLAARHAIRLSPEILAASWDEVGALWHESRARGTEGIMLKRRDSSYGVGRQRGTWWKWKSQPLEIDAVLIAAQPGHGRRAGLFTDYTFGVWHAGELVPVAKAYSGLTDAEIREVDAFVRAHTVGKFGPVCAVEPLLVFELHFEGIQHSSRHRAGIAVRFPRIHRRRDDKQPADADTLDKLRSLVPMPPAPRLRQERLLFDIH